MRLSYLQISAILWYIPWTCSKCVFFTPLQCGLYRFGGFVNLYDLMWLLVYQATLFLHCVVAWAALCEVFAYKCLKCFDKSLPWSTSSYFVNYAFSLSVKRFSWRIEMWRLGEKWLINMSESLKWFSSRLKLDFMKFVETVWESYMDKVLKVDFL